MSSVRRHLQPGLTIARWRFSLAVLLLVLLAAALLWHVALLQVVPGEDRGFEFLQSQGNARSVREEIIPAHRGVITDRNGEPLAVSTPVISLWANPAEFSAESPYTGALAKALGLREVDLRKKLQRYAEKEFVYLRRNLAPQDAELILANGWEGVYGRTEYQRFYPAGEVAAHVVGFTDIDELGREGVELAFDQWLVGQPGSKRVLKDRKGRIIKDDGLVRAPVSGRDVQLSIDLRMQYLAYKELKQAVTEHRARSGSLVMLDTRSGEILAMVNQPSYNPNNRSDVKLAALRNRAVTDQIEPGSTMKPLTIMAALETGRYHPHTIIDTNPGWIHLDRKTLVDPINYGVIDLTRVITKSSQVGISKVALDLPHEQIREMFLRLGLGQGTAIGFPGESVGLLPNRQRWSRIERANFAFGYGMSVTPLQLAQAYAVVANRGIKKSVSLVHQSEQPAGQRVVDSKVASQVIDMLKTVLQADGTAKRAQIEAYPAAGKTGTVHRVSNGSYAADSYRAVFAGMAPASDPRVAVVVVIEEPGSGKYFGGDVAAPVFAKVAEGALRLMHVPPAATAEKAALAKAVKPAQRGPLS
ncbi:MAG: penicillin-binding protein 2 [Gammaproteobacteria bacterium]|nr:penicillin-binding protein 2 [Gammaproteobacteria bacterium]